MQADVTAAESTPKPAWLDPARRQDSRRVSDPEDYSPPLSWLTSCRRRLGSIGVKLSPAMDHALAGRYGAELEFLSEGGECREALLWLGAAAVRATACARRCSRRWAAQPWRARRTTPGRRSPSAAGYLYEPDPAVIRAHLVGTLAQQLEPRP